MKIYIAGAWTKRYCSSMREKFDHVRNLGHEITYDWTSDETIDRSIAAQKDLEGVVNCDVLIAIIDIMDYQYRGTFTEIGCAIGLSKRVIVYCPFNRDQHGIYDENIYIDHPGIERIQEWSSVLDTITHKQKNESVCVHE